MSVSEWVVKTTSGGGHGGTHSGKTKMLQVRYEVQTGQLEQFGKQIDINFKTVGVKEAQKRVEYRVEVVRDGHFD